MAKRCYSCKANKPEGEFHKNQSACKSCQVAYNRRYKERITPEKRRWYRRTEDFKGQQQRRKERRDALRKEMLTEYGGKCSCCGESNYAFLTLEHLNGGGNAHRRRLNKAHYTWRELKEEGWPKSGYTLLCWNCQMGKTHYGICPHLKENNGSA